MIRLVRSEWTWLALAAGLWQFTSELGSPWALSGALALAAAMVVMAVRRPVVGVGLVVASAAYLGGPLVLLAAPLVLLLGYRATRAFRPESSPGRHRWLAAAAALAVLATLPFAGLGYGRSNGGSGSGGSSGGRPGSSGAARPTDGDDLVAAVLRALRRITPEDSGPRWWLAALIVLAVVLAVAVAVAVWIVRRRRRRVGVASASAVTRLESVGRRVGRRRRSDEGVLAYASSLATHTGDGRLGVAGPEVSALVYRSGAASGPRVEQALAALEESPPPRPPRRPLAGLAGRLRARLTLRRAGLPALGALVAVGLVAGAATQLSVLGAADDGRWSLWREPSSTVEQWWSCQTFDVTAVARAGVDHVALDRSATQTHRGVGPVGNDERAVTWDGESVVDYGGEDVPVPADFTRPRLPFADLDAVLDSFGVTDPVVSARRDTTGASFTRYESLPLDELERGLAPVERLGGRWETSVVWVLDVWLDDRDRPVRIRQMIDGDPGWFEWLRLDTPTGDSTPPSCGQAAGGRAGPWLGAEPWSPSLEVPLKVAFDGAGHPYDPSSATEGEEWLAIGGLTSPSGVVALTSLEALVYGAEWGDRAEVVTVPPGTALRAEIYGPGGGAHRIRVETGGGGGTGAGAVARWRPVAELDLLELTPVVAVAEPGFDPDQMAEIYDELGDGVGAGHRLDLDGDGVDDAMVLGGYGNDAQVYVGENAAGAVVELVSVLDDVPWRLLDLPGEPPADVLRREQELAACVAETRPTGPDGVCRRGA